MRCRKTKVATPSTTTSSATNHPGRNKAPRQPPFETPDTAKQPGRRRGGSWGEQRNPTAPEQEKPAQTNEGSGAAALGEGAVPRTHRRWAPAPAPPRAPRGMTSTVLSRGTSWLGEHRGQADSGGIPGARKRCGSITLPGSGTATAPCPRHSPGEAVEPLGALGTSPSGGYFFSELSCPFPAANAFLLCRARQAPVERSNDGVSVTATTVPASQTFKDQKTSNVEKTQKQAQTPEPPTRSPLPIIYCQGRKASLNPRLQKK